MPKAWLVTAMALLAVACGRNSASGPSSSSSAPPSAAGPPRNLTILKGYTAAQIHDNMLDMDAALGVQCGFCHVLPDYASDANDKKQVARRMLLMTAAINGDNFDGRQEISCYTCHHGQVKTRRGP